MPKSKAAATGGRSKKKEREAVETPVNTDAMSDYMKEKYAVMGHTIRANRQQRKFTTHELAELLNLSDSYIGLLERGARNPSLDVLLRICELFGITPNDLLLSGAGQCKVSESKSGYNLKMHVESITSLARNLNDKDADIVINLIKGLIQRSKEN